MLTLELEYSEDNLSGPFQGTQMGGAEWSVACRFESPVEKRTISGHISGYLEGILVHSATCLAPKLTGAK